jgi:hypothetical protein
LAVTTALPLLHRSKDQLVSRLNTTHHFDNKIDLWIIDDRIRLSVVKSSLGIPGRSMARSRDGDLREDERYASTSGKIRCICNEQAGDLSSDMAAAEHSNVKGLTYQGTACHEINSHIVPYSGIGEGSPNARKRQRRSISDIQCEKIAHTLAPSEQPGDSSLHGDDRGARNMVVIARH